MSDISLSRKTENVYELRIFTSHQHYNVVHVYYTVFTYVYKIFVNRRILARVLKFKIQTRLFVWFYMKCRVAVDCTERLFEL